MQNQMVESQQLLNRIQRLEDWHDEKEQFKIEPDQNQMMTENLKKFEYEIQKINLNLQDIGRKQQEQNVIVQNQYKKDRLLQESQFEDEEYSKDYNEEALDKILLETCQKDPKEQSNFENVEIFMQSSQVSNDYDFLKNDKFQELLVKNSSKGDFSQVNNQTPIRRNEFELSDEENFDIIEPFEEEAR